MKTSIKYLLVYFALTLLGALILAFPAVIMGMVTSPAPIDSNEMELSPWAMSMIMVGSQLLPLFVFWKKKWSDFSWLRNQKYARLFLCLIVGWIGCLCIDCTIADYMPKYDWDYEILDSIENMQHNVLGIIAACVLAPLVEEGIFRGAIERKLLEKNWNPWWAIVISATIFALVHMNLTQGLIAMILGLFLGWIYYRTRNLWLCVFVHALNNTFSTVCALTIGDVGDSGFGLSLPVNLLILVAGAIVVYVSARLLVKNLSEHPVAPTPPPIPEID